MNRRRGRYDHFHSHDGRVWQYIGSGRRALGYPFQSIGEDAIPAPTGDGSPVVVVADEIAELRGKLKHESKYYQTQTLSAFLLGLSLGAYTAKYKAVTTAAFAVSALLVGLAANTQGQPVNPVVK